MDSFCSPPDGRRAICREAKTGRKRETEMREKAGPKVTRGTSGKGILGPVMQLGS